MKNMVEKSEKELLKLEKLLKKIEVFLGQVPEGCLKWQKRGEKIYYYHQYKEQDTWKRKYLPDGKPEMAKTLAKKHYYMELKRNIERKKEILTKLVNKWPCQELDAIYDELCEERKRLINPIQKTVSQKAEEFQKEIYERNTLYSENLRYETDQGEMVRSKSEVIIANMLYQHRDFLIYKYEKPLRLVTAGNVRILYPDFTIIHRKSGKLYYWEHAGLMGDSHYAGDFVKKMNLYVQNELIPGKDVIITYETSEVPLVVGVVRRLIRWILEA